MAIVSLIELLIMHLFFVVVSNTNTYYCVLLYLSIIYNISRIFDLKYFFFDRVCSIFHHIVKNKYSVIIYGQNLLKYCIMNIIRILCRNKNS